MAAEQSGEQSKFAPVIAIGQLCAEMPEQLKDVPMVSTSTNRTRMEIHLSLVRAQQSLFYLSSSVCVSLVTYVLSS